MTTHSLTYGPFISRKQALEQGLTQYFLGKQCPSGHVAPHRVGGGCRACQALVSKRVREVRLATDPDYAQKRRDEAKADYYKNKQARVAKASDNVRRRRSTVNGRLLDNLRARISMAFKESGVRKSRKTCDLLGCSVPEAKIYLQKRFLPGMTWDNHGEWHIDHIRPCASFDLTDPEQQKQCFHYTNLQPLWAADNLAKSDKWEVA